jgi:hypothetical protein
VYQHLRPHYVTQEIVPQTTAQAGIDEQPGNLSHNEAPVVDHNHAQDRLQCGKGVAGNLRPCLSRNDRDEKGEIMVMSRFIPQTFNDFFALFVVALIVALWIVQGISAITLRDDVNGALVVLFTLIVQYYFRRAPPDKPTP